MRLLTNHVRCQHANHEKLSAYTDNYIHHTVQMITNFAPQEFCNRQRGLRET